MDHHGRRGLMGSEKGMGALDWWPRWGEKTVACGYQMKRMERETQREVIKTESQSGWGVG